MEEKELFTEIFECDEYYNLLDIEYTIQDLWNFIFDRLEKKELVKWTKIYNRDIIFEAYTRQIKLHLYMELQPSSTSKPLKKVFNYTGIFDNKGNRQWELYLLNVCNFKRCPSCKRILHYDRFHNDVSNKETGKSWECKECKKPRDKEYHKNNKEVRNEQSKQYYIDNKTDILEDRKKYANNNNKDKISNQQYNRKVVTLNHLYSSGLIHLECEICGYNHNWAAIENHHIDDTIQLPDWAYNSKEKRVYPSNYIFSKEKEKAEERYKYEKDNLAQICRNCHTKISQKSTDSQQGLREALHILGIIYKCEKCEENTYLELHHKIPEEKFCSFSYFTNQPMEKIMKEGILEKEMNKHVRILCGNHHAEIENPNWEISKIIGVSE